MTERIYTANEVAVLSGTTKSAVEKAIHQRIFRVRKMTVPGSRRRVRTVDEAALYYLVVQRRIAVHLQNQQKKRLYAHIRSALRGGTPWAWELSPGLTLDTEHVIEDVRGAVETYAEARDRFIELNPQVLAGSPVIRDTRISVYGIAETLAGGESPEALAQEYEVPIEAIRAAALYAEAHPRMGRPAHSEEKSSWIVKRPAEPLDARAVLAKGLAKSRSRTAIS
jgi:uncharacterized protein (DUF433 family)